MKAEGRILDLAASVADGADVDWLAAETGAEEVDRRLVRHLRLVADVAELYRSLPETRAADATEPADERAPDGPRWGRLVLLEKIGEGTSSEVYRAWDPELQREVALKLLRADGSEAEAARWRMLGEARRLARVRHPHVVLVFGADRRDDGVGLWMEFVDGATLDDIVRRSGLLGAREAALIGLDLCRALAAVHAAGLAHRDVKAQNVMRESGGRIVLMDFGTGEEIKRSGAAPRLAGTPLYLAPEILAGGAASATSDLYGLGVLLFYLVTGQFPIAAATFDDLVKAHGQRDVRRLRDLRPDLPEAFVRVVERALAPAPASRYASAGAMEAVLRESLAGTGPTVATFPAARLANRGWWAMAAGVVLAAVVALLVILLSGRREPAQPLNGTIDELAVLPLVDRSGGAAPPYLAEALTDELIATLGQIRSLRITSSTSVRPFKSRTAPIADIARSLGVDAVLEGSISLRGEAQDGDRRVTVNARLLAAGTGQQLWAGTFEGPAGGALARDLARAIARQIRGALSPEETQHLQEKPAVRSDVTDAYFQGRFHFNRTGTEDLRRAVAAFNRAVKLDPDFAPAHAGLARAYLTLGGAGGMSQPAARAEALAAASRALGLDPTLAEAHVALADVKFFYDWTWPDADAGYRRAIALNPSLAYARSQYARFLSAQGRLAEAVDQARRAQDLDPLSAEAALTTGLMHFYAREFEPATEQIEHALREDPRFARGYALLARVHEAQGRYAEALEAVDQALGLTDGAPGAWQMRVPRLYALQGRRAEALRRLGELEQTAAAGRVYISPEYRAYVYAALGDDEQALRWLERAVAERDASVLWLKVDPRVDRYRAMPRFQSLVRALGLTP